MRGAIRRYDVAANGSFDTLRTEVIESQKVRSDLLKWKLLICAVVGATALGLSEKATKAPLALAVIPLACLYVDLLCRHLSLRNHAIGCFLRESKHADEVLKAYEKYYREASKGWFSLEDLALIGFTVVVSIIVYFVGMSALDVPLWSWGWPAVLFPASAGLAILFSGALEFYYRCLRKKYEVSAEPSC
jgi:hypothetical protein